MNKVVSSAEAAVADIPSGATVMLGGFGLCGIPENLIAALVRRGSASQKDSERLCGLHTISNNMDVDDFGMGLMLEAGMIASHIGSYVGENRLLEKQVLAGTLDLTLLPQGNAGRTAPRGWSGDSGLLCGDRAGDDCGPRARRHASSMAAGMCWNEGCARTSRW